MENNDLNPLVTNTETAPQISDKTMKAIGSSSILMLITSVVILVNTIVAFLIDIKKMFYSSFITHIVSFVLILFLLRAALNLRKYYVDKDEYDLEVYSNQHNLFWIVLWIVSLLLILIFILISITGAKV
jgi:putative copper export protein